MSCDVERLINALIGAEMLAQRKRAEDAAARPVPGPVVTVSRGCGAQGAALARLVAERLGVRCCDREILEEVARRARTDVALLECLDEHARLAPRDWWHALLNGERVSRDDYLRYLVQVVLGIGRTGGVILGRGANLILGSRGAFRVRVVGGLDNCAARVAAREGIDLNTARRRVQEVDAERARFVRKLYRADIDASVGYDLVLNSDRLAVDGLAELVLAGVRLAGLTNGVRTAVTP